MLRNGNAVMFSYFPLNSLITRDLNYCPEGGDGMRGGGGNVCKNDYSETV